MSNESENKLARRVDDKRAEVPLNWSEGTQAQPAAPVDVMIDIETLGTTPGSAILSIGAVVFGPDGLGDTFYAPILLQSCVAAGLTIDPNTIAWWMQQSDAARAAAFRPDADALAEVLEQFTCWFGLVDAERPWCHGATFDVPLLEVAYKACGLKAPWRFHAVRDTRTLYDLAGVKVNRAQGTHHNALDDAMAQADAAVKALQILRERASTCVISAESSTAGAAKGQLTDDQIDSHIIKSGVMDKAWPTQVALHAFARAIEAEVAGRCRAQGDITSLEGLTRYREYVLENEGGIEESSKGEYVKLADVERLLASTAVEQKEPGDLHNAIMNLREKSPYDRVRHESEYNAYKIGHRDARHAAAELANEYAASQAAPASPEHAQALTVWEGAMPESNGRSNFTAVLHRKDAEGFDIFTDGFQFARSEHPDRVRYEADFMRWLIGEREVKPELRDDCYDFDKHSGYVPPTKSAAPIAAAPAAPTDLSKRLRAKATQPFGPEDFALLTAAAEEIERYYGGMMAWKKTAQKKDADWNAERMARIDERCTARAMAPAAPEQDEVRDIENTLRECADALAYVAYNYDGSKLEDLAPNIVESTSPSTTALIAERRARAAIRSMKRQAISEGEKKGGV
jgi:hypothetical protein